MSFNDVKRRLIELESQTGRLLPSDVLEEARDLNSPLHGYFEWDDATAAEQHRLRQARQLIRRVRIDVIVHDVPLSVVRYVRDPDPDANGGAYRHIMRLRTEEDLARATVIDEMTRVSKAAKRAKAIAAVLGIQADIEAIETIANGVQERISLSDTAHGGAA